MAGRNVLLIGRVGDRSLQRHWIDGAGEERAFDLHLSYYGQLADPFPDRPADASVSHDPGAKFPGLSACLTKLGDRLQAYEWICFVDDDIWARHETWARFFAVVEKLRPALAQPALKRGSFYSHDITLERPQYEARWTNFVEIMNFCFRRDFLEKVRASFDLNESGWGLDYVWAREAEPAERSLLIVDAAPVLHTRAVGRGGLYDVLAGGTNSARADRVNITAEKPKPVAYAGVLADGSIVSDDRLNKPLYIPRRVHKLRKMFNVVTVRPPA